MNEWFSYISKDRKIRGIVLSRSKAEVARLAGYPISKLIIERVVWNGEEFVSELKKEIVYEV